MTTNVNPKVVEIITKLLTEFVEENNEKYVELLKREEEELIENREWDKLCEKFSDFGLDVFSELMSEEVKDLTE